MLLLSCWEQVQPVLPLLMSLLKMMFEPLSYALNFLLAFYIYRAKEKSEAFTVLDFFESV